MRNKKEMEREIQNLTSKINELASQSSGINQLLTDKARSDETGSGLIALIKYLVDQNHSTTMILKEMQERLRGLDAELNTDYYEQDDTSLQENRLGKVMQPISGLDAKIMQIIQIRGMACAADIRKEMGYKGNNAASARLNKLYAQGLLERYQLGHRVFYKFNAGKTTNTLIVSPPQ